MKIAGGIHLRYVYFLQYFVCNVGTELGTPRALSVLDKQDVKGAAAVLNVLNHVFIISPDQLGLR